jgi:predicted DNA-binding ribbon-helix-helix protein
MTFKGGGYLLIEDAHGCTRSTFLETGFFDFLNEVLDEHDCNSCFLCARLRCM